MKESFKNSSKGFTLVELLVVIAIIAILVLIVVVALNPVERVDSAKDQRANADVRSIGNAIAACVTNESAHGSTTAWASCATRTTLMGPEAYVASLDAFFQPATDNTCLATGCIYKHTSLDRICTSRAGRSGKYATWWLATTGGGTVTPSSLLTGVAALVNDDVSCAALT